MFRKSLVVQLFLSIFGGNADSPYGLGRKRYVNFGKSKKIGLIWETDGDKIKESIVEALASIHEKPDACDFQITTGPTLSVIKPPDSISFYTFHYVIQWLSEANLKSAGLVVSPRMAYSFYNDPDSENLIGRTDRGAGFYISLLEDYGARPFLRMSKYIVTPDVFNVESLKAYLKEEEQLASQTAGK
ncbi:hypothetical protein [Chryseolinea serpens]|uniref:hypothetical protein n=1 Tax=Chryseolinea serpens TaxID=947013 RepID=UPI0011612D6F|nr:hypothetical protein [Chryseolinea serpens]